MGSYISFPIYGEDSEKQENTKQASEKIYDRKFYELSLPWQYLLESAEHQAEAALMIANYNEVFLKSQSPRKFDNVPVRSTNRLGNRSDKGKVNSNKLQKILREQLKGLQKTQLAIRTIHEAMIDSELQKVDFHLTNTNIEKTFYNPDLKELKKELHELLKTNKHLHQQKIESENLMKSSESFECQCQDEKVASDEEEMDYQILREDCVQVFPGKIKQCNLIENFVHLLKQHYETIGSRLDVKCVDDIGDIQADLPVLVLCINVSRLAHDAESALLGMNRNKFVGLVIMHHKEVHAPAIEPSERLLSLSSTFKSKALGKIFDMAFLSTEGIYRCEMNNMAINNICSFIKSAMV